MRARGLLSLACMQLQVFSGIGVFNFCIAVIEIHVQKLHDPLNSDKYVHVIFVSQGSSSLFFLFFFKKGCQGLYIRHYQFYFFLGIKYNMHIK